MSNESEIRKYLAEREAISREYLGIKEEPEIPEKPKKPTVKSLEAKLRVQERTITNLRKKLREAESQFLEYEKQLSEKSNALVNFKNATEELIKTCAKIELLTAESQSSSDEVHKYAARVCEDLLLEVQKLREK